MWLVLPAAKQGQSVEFTGVYRLLGHTVEEIEGVPKLDLLAVENGQSTCFGIR